VLKMVKGGQSDGIYSPSIPGVGFGALPFLDRYVSTTVSEATEAKIALPKAVAKAKTTTVKINGRVVSNDQVEAAIGAQLITTGMHWLHSAQNG